MGFFVDGGPKGGLWLLFHRRDLRFDRAIDSPVDALNFAKTAARTVLARST